MNRYACSVRVSMTTCKLGSLTEGRVGELSVIQGWQIAVVGAVVNN